MDSVRRSICRYTESMKLAIDIREACRTPLTGKGRWTAGFVSALLEHGVQLVLLSDRPLPLLSAETWKNATVHVIPSSGLFWHLKATGFILRNKEIDAYVSTVSYLVPVLLRGRKPCITVVHDLISFRQEPHDRRAMFIEHVTMQIAMRYSSLICTVSESTARDLREKLPMASKRIMPIFAGCDQRIAIHPTKGNGPIVCIGTLCPRKNQLRLIHAYVQLPEDLRKKHPLVLIGSRGWGDDAIIHATQHTRYVLWIGSVTDAERDAILKEAIMVAFPSLYEGFGFPVLEAFAAGIPVLTSHGGSLAEVAGDAALIVDPLDETSVTEGLRKMLEQRDLRHSFALKGLKRAQDFSWDKTADLFLQAVDIIGR